METAKATTGETKMMTIESMIANVRDGAKANGGKYLAWAGDYQAVFHLLSAYHGGFNVGNMDNHNRVRT
jgi:hypothetical protein